MAGKAAGPKKGSKAAADAPEGPEEANVAAALVAGVEDLATVPAKKKRNNNPGIRVQGGRVYDSENGTTCHQCRQKTAETKAKCTACTLYFCPKCLENRYQEKVEEVNVLPGWRCPRCRGDCNCSNCRKKAGKEATGQLAGIAKKAGFGSVKELLVKNPHAKAIHLPRLPSAATDGGASGGGAARSRAPGEGEAGEAVPRKRTAAKRKAAEAAAQQELLPDEELPPREQPMPEPRPLAALKSVGGPTGASKRPRGGLAWTAALPEETALPGGRAGAELATVLEFLQVFGSKLQLRALPLAALAAELLQPAAAPDGPPPLCGAADESLVGSVHCRLLDVVRAYWNVKGSVAAGSWQGVMRGYYAAAQLGQRQALNLRWRHGPPAVAGEIFSRPAAPEGGDEPATQAEADEEPAVGAGGAAAAASVEYPPGGYWALAPATRVAMLHALSHDALECGELRAAIEGSMGDALDEEKERRAELAGVRREARAAVARERDQQIALMIASAATGGLSLEQQQAMLEEARQRAEANAAGAAAAKLRALTEKVHPPTVRAAVVGSDREGRRYLQLQSAPLYAGGGGSVVVQAPGDEAGSAADEASSGGGGEAFGVHPAAGVAAVAAALHPRGAREGALRAALARAFKLPAAAGGSPGSGASRGGSQEPTAETQTAEPEAAEPEAADLQSAEPQGSEPGAELEGHGSSEASAESGASPAAPAASGEVAEPAAGTLKAAARQRKPSVAPAPEPETEAAPSPGAKRSRKPAARRGRTARPTAEAGEPAGEPAAAGKRGRQSGGQQGGGATKRARAKPPAAESAPAAATRGARRTSPRGGEAGGREAGFAASRAPRARRAAAAKPAAQPLPLKVDDMLSA